MSRRTATLLFAGVAAVTLGLVTWLLVGGLGPVEPTVVDGEPPEPAEPETADPWTFTLYFPGADGRLHRESRELPARPRDLEARTERLAEEVLAGPDREGLVRPFPGDVRLGGAFVTAERIAYVDLRASEESGLPSMGSQRELLILYSLVDSILRNESDLAGVAVLWNGSQRPTLAGHVDLGRAYRRPSDLVARAGS